MPEYIARLKHDNGTRKIRTFASCKRAAKVKIMNAELCPESAITRIRNTKRRVAIIDTGSIVEIRRTAARRKPDYIDGSLWNWITEFTTITKAVRWCEKNGYSYIDIDLSEK